LSATIKEKAGSQMSQHADHAPESLPVTSSAPSELPEKQEALATVGEPEIKVFVRASIDEALKLERAMSQLRTTKRVVVLHYAPIAATTEGEAPEISPFLGTSRLAEVIDRHGADLVVHGHAHGGKLNGQTTGGTPVHNVAITLLQSQQPPAAYRVFNV
jgi:Icc-related predicted phosphoesterase